MYFSFVSPTFLVSFFDHLSSSLHKLSPHSFSSFVLIGDFNINFCTSDHPYFCKLNTILQYFSLTQVVQTPTHFSSGSSSLIDLALVSSVDQVLQCSTVPQLGDHDKCSFHLGISLILKCKSIVQQVKQPPRKIWRYDLADFNRANQLIDQTDWDSILINDDIDSAVQNWTNKFMEIMHACIPQQTLRKKSNVPWLNSNIVRHIRQRNSAFQAAKRSSKPNVFGKYKKLRNKVVKLLRSSKKEFYGRINLADKKQFWKTIKFLSKKQTSIPELHHLGESAKTSKAKAEMLNAFFGSCFNTSTPPLSTSDATNLVHDCSEDLLCSPSEILGLINTLDAQKSSGPDGISVKMLKATATSIAPSIAKLFNISINLARFPQSWKISSIVPIPKSKLS